MHWIARLLVVAALSLAAAEGLGAQHTPPGEMVSAWHVTIAPAWFDPSTAYSAWREKKLRGLFLTAAANSGNAAARVEAFIYSKGSYTYGGYPDIDELFQQQAHERARREALLHRIQQLTVERVMFAPIMDLRALMGGHLFSSV
jgi:hypothetical protein